MVGVGERSRALPSRWTRPRGGTVAPLLLLVLGLAAAAPASAARPVALFSYYDGEDLPTIVGEFNAAGLPRSVPIYFGNYWGSPRGSEPPGTRRPPPPTVTAGPRFSYAPMMPLRPGLFWERRRVSPELADALARAGDGHLAGPMPSLRTILRGSTPSRVAWGQELGRRFRDRFRIPNRHGLGAVTWQLDEIRTEAAGRRGRPLRDFTRGVLLGLRFGRPALGDGEVRGFVHVAHRAFRLARGRGAEVARFWRTVDGAAVRLIGEEYVRFRGSPRRAARAQAAGQRALRRAGGARRALANRYVVGMTPGHRMLPGLGGNVGRLSRARVNRWRRGFVRARARMGVSGFSQFNFRGANGSPAAIRDAVRALAFGVRLLR